jgi:hypothetical protein
VRVVLQCGIAVYLLSRATLPDMLLSWCTHRPSSPSTLRLHSKTGTAGSNVNGLLLRSFELLLQARMATKAAAASPGHDRAPASTSEEISAAGTARVDQGRQARRPPAKKHEEAKNQQRHRPTKQRTPQGCVAESAAVVSPDPAEGWKEEPPERVARKKTPPERNARKKTPLERKEEAPERMELASTPAEKARSARRALARRGGAEIRTWRCRRRRRLCGVIS